jgi:hypothetical protein
MELNPEQGYATIKMSPPLRKYTVYPTVRYLCLESEGYRQTFSNAIKRMPIGKATEGAIAIFDHLSGKEPTGKSTRRGVLNLGRTAISADPNLIGFFPQRVNQTFFSAAALFAGRGKEKIKKALPLKDIDGKANNKSTYKAPDGVRPDWWTDDITVGQLYDVLAEKIDAGRTFGLRLP